MPVPRCRSAVAAIALLAWCATGCGGGEAKDRLTAQQFREKAEAICTQTFEKTARANSGLTQSSPKKELDAAVRKVADALDDEAASIKALDEPRALSDDVDAMLKTLTAAAERIRSQGSAVLDATKDPLADFVTKAKDLDLPTCAGESS